MSLGVMSGARVNVSPVSALTRPPSRPMSDSDTSPPDTSSTPITPSASDAASNTTDGDTVNCAAGDEGAPGNW